MSTHYILNITNMQTIHSQKEIRPLCHYKGLPANLASGWSLQLGFQVGLLPSLTYDLLHLIDSRTTCLPTMNMKSWFMLSRKCMWSSQYEALGTKSPQFPWLTTSTQCSTFFAGGVIHVLHASTQRRLGKPVPNFLQTLFHKMFPQC